MDNLQIIAKELGLEEIQVKNTIDLIKDGASVPFIARYRKEVTKNLDEEQIRDVVDRYEYLEKLAQRKEEVIRLIEEQGALTEELQKSIMACIQLQQVEDLYLPYKKKKKTKADIAKELGLEPLADFIKEESTKEADLIEKAKEFVSEEVETPEAALDMACLIIAQEISEVALYREKIRKYLLERGEIIVQGTKNKLELDPKGVFADYYDHREKVSALAPHRTLAFNRGESEKVLRVKLELDPVTLMMIQGIILKEYPNANLRNLYIKIVEDAYKRLIFPSVEREVRNTLTEIASDKAIENFKKNLKALLQQPPIRGKCILGLDPGYRTGCKSVIIDSQGFFQYDDIFYLVEGVHSPNQLKKAKDKILELIKKYNVDIIAIGNGTASRETEQFAANLIKDAGKEVQYLIVNEAGASVYSASPLAKEEYPDLDVTARGAISIAKRIQDPLAELVKIDPKSIGVGMYQHDVNQKTLEKSLDEVIENVVNAVGVDVNSASYVLLSHISGVKKNIAKNIVSYRKDNGDFKTRKELMDVKGLGKKAFEQMAGFLVIKDGDNPLETTIIHPESYKIATAILKENGFSLEDFKNDLKGTREAIRNFDHQSFAKENDFGEVTTADVFNALITDPIDPRDMLDKPLLKSDILKLTDLKPGMELEGTVRNIVSFGAFVDVGLKNDGLLHISEVSDKHVKDVSDVLQVGEIIKVYVKDIDEKRARLALTRKKY